MLSDFFAAVQADLIARGIQASGFKIFIGREHVQEQDPNPIVVVPLSDVYTRVPPVSTQAYANQTTTDYSTIRNLRFLYMRMVTCEVHIFTTDPIDNWAAADALLHNFIVSMDNVGTGVFTLGTGKYLPMGTTYYGREYVLPMTLRVPVTGGLVTVVSGATQTTPQTADAPTGTATKPTGNMVMPEGSGTPQKGCGG